jgi:uncharacterized membrane protein YeaQ/YmgE (transglycosylase-associated protein family)
MPAAAIVLLVMLEIVIFGSLAGWIGQQKGRRPEEGMLLGALFGPLGVIVVALLPTPGAE